MTSLGYADVFVAGLLPLLNVGPGQRVLVRPMYHVFVRHCTSVPRLKSDRSLLPFQSRPSERPCVARAAHLGVPRHGSVLVPVLTSSSSQDGEVDAIWNLRIGTGASFG